MGRSLALEADVSLLLSFPLGFRFARFCLGRLLVMLLLVAVMKLELAALRIGVGSARKIL